VGEFRPYFVIAAKGIPDEKASYGEKEEEEGKD